MNYIELINWFWELDETWQFSCCETRLYFYLVKTANRLGWENNWTRSDAKVSSDVGVSPNSMKTARNRLVQAGLISTKQGGNGFRDKTRYQILIPKPTPNHIPNLIPNHEPNLAPINKLKHKQKQIINPPYIPPGGEVCDDEKNHFSDNSHNSPPEEKEKSCAKKEKELNYSFDVFWELYDKKVGKKESLIKKWLKLSDLERELAMGYIPKYKLATPDKKYRKNPETFLNQKAWNDELIFENQQNENNRKQSRSPDYKSSDFD